MIRTFCRGYTKKKYFDKRKSILKKAKEEKK